MQHLKLDISYDGSRFFGSATQPHKNTVQDSLNSALSRMGIFNGCLMASRTDKGVHASHNVCKVSSSHHFKDLDWVAKKLNIHLNEDIVIKKITQVNEDFNPRFDAKYRQYRYILCHKPLNPFLSKYYTFYKEVDINYLNLLLQNLVGTYDFSNFCLVNQSTSNIRTIYKAYAYRYFDFSIVCFVANGFLRGQIRYMMGFLLKALEGRFGINELILQRDNQTNFSHTLAPPNGLYLSRIVY